MSCTVNLPSPPPDVYNIAVYVNKQLVLQDATNGWTYGATNMYIVLNGSYCDTLVTAQDASVDVLFGCPGLPPIPPICIP